MRVSVIGSGVMGKGIVSLLCANNFVTHINWVGKDGVSVGARASVERDLKRLTRRSVITEEQYSQGLDKLEINIDLCCVSGDDMIIEAIIESQMPKQKLFIELSNYVSEEAIVATNTSSLSITSLGMELPHPENFVGIHFFNPALQMLLVEVVAGHLTSKETIGKAVKFAEKLGKTPVVVNESPGFIVNRMLIPMINEAVSIYAEGVASKEEIDKAMKNGANHPLGPLALADLIGNDICLSIMETLYAETGDPKYRAHPLLRKMVRAHHLGRKTNIGFYIY